MEAKKKFKKHKIKLKLKPFTKRKQKKTDILDFSRKTIVGMSVAESG